MKWIVLGLVLQGITLSAFAKPQCTDCYLYRASTASRVQTLLVEYLNDGFALVWDKDIEAVPVHKWVNRIPCTREQEPALQQESVPYEEEDISFQRWHESGEALIPILFKLDPPVQKNVLPHRIEVLFYEIENHYWIPGYLKLIFRTGDPQCFIVRLPEIH